ncbi:MAG: RICIN domain-containing protein [Eubacterium sp.]|nr:RICIN domain-containing protein [Eubacterium sp.]
MSDNIRRLKCGRGLVWAVRICLLAGAFLLRAETPSAAETAAKAKAPLEQLEKAMVSSSTKRIWYRAGKSSSAQGRYWRGAKKLSVTASRLKIRKKGWYTFRVMKASGKYRVFTLRLKKKTYPVSVNTPVKQKAGHYLLVPKSSRTQALGTRGASLLGGCGTALQPKGQSAAGVWLLEPAGGTAFRLKNCNSGLYLTCRESKKKRLVTQNKGNPSNRGQLYRCYSAGGAYYYIRNVLTGEYLNVSGGSLSRDPRHSGRAWKFRLSETGRPQSRFAVEGETYPVSLVCGKAFSLKGSVTSFYTIKSLTLRVVDGQGRVCLQKTAAPWACRYDLAEADAAMTFGRLAAGSYLYQVVIQDVTGRSAVAVNRAFVVYVPGGAVARTLIYNSDAVAAVGHQSGGNDLEKKACASYALAYCNAILTGTAVSPHTYWSSTTNVDCVWSRGGYTTGSYHSEQEVLQAAYGQLLANRPCILHVTGKTGNQHWVTLIGYRNVTTGVLTAANFIGIDPWSGETVTVSDSYQVRNTYRLAYKGS